MSGLFARDEMDEILQELIAAMKKEFPRRPPSNENLNEYYLSRVRKNLHVVLCFSPVSREVSLNEATHCVSCAFETELTITDVLIYFEFSCFIFLWFSSSS